MTKAELYQKACMLPLLPGVYIIRDKTDTIIYIGKAKRLRIRVSQYFREGVPHDNKVSQMIAHAYAFDVIVCQSEFEALVLEASQIKAHTPKYNILLKDDKGYSYIKVTKEPWPRLSFVLQKEEDDAEYIGPYTSSFAARQMAETAMDAFLLPRCNKRFPQEIGKGRPCLNAHIGKCMAVCSGRISCENYNQAVKSAVHLIRYGKKDILKILNERMQEASDRLEFETAALLRDQIAAITKVSAGQKVIVDPDVEMDVVALAGTPDSVCAAVLRFRDGRLTDKREFLFHDTSDIAAVREEFLPRYYLDDEQIPKIIAVDELPPDSDALQQALNEKRGSEVQLYVPQRGDKAHLVEMAHTNAVERLARESGRYAREEKLLDELAQVLGLAKPPRAIESYDISNWGDGSSVCGMVTFRDGKPYKAGYRRFKMKTVAGTDDYASLAETVSRRAAEYEKYAELAKKGEPCSNWFGQKPDLLLMDVMLPDESGYDIVRKLRKDPTTRQLPIIMVTAKTAEMDMIKGLDEGADDYIKKPFSIMELITRVKALLRRTITEDIKYLQVDNLVLDHERHMVFVDNKQVELTFKEYELLRLLMTNQNVVLSREVIMRHVWGTEFEGESRTVDMHIKTLRQKLGEAGSKIRTVRNVGYVIEKA